MTASNAMRPTAPLQRRLARQRGCSPPPPSRWRWPAARRMDDPTRVAGWTLIDPSQRHPILVSQEPTTHLIRIAARLERACRRRSAPSC